MSRLFAPFYFVFDLMCAAVDRAMHLDFEGLEDAEPCCDSPELEWSNAILSSSTTGRTLVCARCGERNA